MTNASAMLGPGSEPSRSFDATWIARIRAGDNEAFERVFRRFYPMLLRTAARLVRGQDVADDIVMDVFLTMWRKRSELAIRGDIGAYLHTAVRHRALNALSRQRLERSWQGVFAAEGTSPAFSEHHRGVHEALEQEELETQCAEAMARLPMRARQVAQMRFIDRMGRTEIAATLGISVSTVKAHLTTALRALRASFRAS